MKSIKVFMAILTIIAILFISKADINHGYGLIENNKETISQHQ